MSREHFEEPAERLLRHASFIRSLARGLLRDDDLAEEVWQRTWIQAQTRGPEKADSLRSWLATVAKNFARQLQRSEARRRAREQRAARPEGVASTEELVARESMVKEIAIALDSLEASHRHVVYLRFYEALSMPEIAAELGIPLETARTRLRRSLGKLRRRLDAEYGDRTRWAPLLVPLAAPSGPSLPLTPIPRRVPRMSLATTITGAAGVTALLFSLSPLLREEEPIEPFSSSANSTAVRMADSQTIRDGAERHDVRDLDPASSESVTEPSRTGKPASAPLEWVPRHRWAARLVDSEGRPVPKLTGVWRVAGGDILDRGTSDDSGRLEMTTERDLRGKKSSFEVESDAWVSGRYSIDETSDPATPLEIRVLRMAAISGEVRQSDGEILDTPLEVHVDAYPRVPASVPPFFEDHWSTTTRDDSGRFRIDGIVPREVQITLIDRELGLTRQLEPILLREGETRELDLEPPWLLDSTLVLELESEAALGALLQLLQSDPGSFSIDLGGPAGHRSVSLEGIEPRRRRLVIEDLDSGDYALSVRHPAFLPYEAVRIPSGTVHTVELEGAAAVDLVVMASGEPFEQPFEARLLDQSGHEIVAAPETKGHVLSFTKLAPGRYSFEIESRGERRSSPEVEVTAGPASRVQVDWEKAAPSEEIRGLVRYPDGSPVEDIAVALLVPMRSVKGDSAVKVTRRGGGFFMGRPGQPAPDEAVAETRTDATGAFALSVPEEGPYHIRAATGGNLSVQAGPFDDAPTDPIELTIPKPATIRGQIRPVAGRETAAREMLPRLRVQASRPIDPRRFLERLSSGNPAAPEAAIEGDGSFELAGLAAGQYRLFLVFPSAADPRASGRSAVGFFSGGNQGEFDTPARSLVLGDLTLDEGGLEHPEYSLENEWPGQVELRVEQEGRPLPGARVEVLEKTESYYAQAGSAKPASSLVIRGVVGTDGIARLGPLAPGLHQAEVKLPEVLSTAVPVRVEPGRVSRSQIDVVITDGTLICLDADTGAPLAGVEIHLRRSRETMTRVTNGRGELHLKLSSGPIEVSTRSDLRDAIELEWTTSGPSVGTVRLDR
ncbi:MAG: sigma-70 family RNA polymerase sigma factor [Planctomycetota bacterium]